MAILASAIAKGTLQKKGEVKVKRSPNGSDGSYSFCELIINGFFVRLGFFGAIVHELSKFDIGKEVVIEFNIETKVNEKIDKETGEITGNWYNQELYGIGIREPKAPVAATPEAPATATE